jgi:hypothetical protein
MGASGIAGLLIRCGAEDSRRAFSGEIAGRLVGRGPSAFGEALEGLQPEPALAVAGGG